MVHKPGQQSIKRQSKNAYK